MPAEITIDDLNEWRTNHWSLVASCAGKGSLKRLEVNPDNIYRVADHGRCLYLGAAAENAIKEYNSAV